MFLRLLKKSLRKTKTTTTTSKECLIGMVGGMVKHETLLDESCNKSMNNELGEENA